MGFLSKIFGSSSKEAALASSEVVKPKSNDVKNISLFIVDDNESFLNLIKNHLINKEKERIIKVKYSITAFTNGESCIENLDMKPDIILLDYYLRGDNENVMNGDEVFKKLMSINPNQKVVMLSGQEESSIVLSLIKLGLRDYIMKDDEMFEQLHRVLFEVFESK